MLKITNHADQIMTLEKFKKKKKVNPYKNMRTNAKFVNFGFIFGQMALAFAMGTLRDNWTQQDCERFIKDKNLHMRRGEVMTELHLGAVDAEYYVCAEYIRESWFKLYPGVDAWIEASFALAKKQGYIRSPFGARRLFPELTYQGTESNRRRIKNLKNITCNSPVQNHEVVLMHRAMRYFRKYCLEHNFESYLIGNVHDAKVAYLKKSEVEELVPVIHDAFSADYAENQGIPMEGEINLADPSIGDFWGFGRVNIEKKDQAKFKLTDFDKLEKKDMEFFKEKNEDRMSGEADEEDEDQTMEDGFSWFSN